MLVSVHYGTGFLLGTGEKSLVIGAAGSLYAVSTGLGVLSLLVFAKFYWTEVHPIWTLLGDRYGRQAKTLVGLMSWAWMVGIVSAQILGGAFILKVLGASLLPSMVWLAGLIMLISLLPVEQAGRLFQGLLILSSLALLYSLWRMNSLQGYSHSVLDFGPALSRLSVNQVVGIPLATVLLTVIGMDFHQFVVRARDVRHAYLGCVLAGLVLLLLAFLPSSVVVAAEGHGILPASLEGKEVIPFILSWVGGGSGKPIGILLIMSLLVAVLGSGGGVLRVMNQTLFDFDLLSPSNKNRGLVAIANTLLVLAIASTGRQIIDLIVAFYAVYVAGALIPFLAYVLDKKERVSFSARTIRLSLVLGSASAVMILIATQIAPATSFLGSAELTILLIGIGFSVVGLLVGKVLRGRVYDIQI